MSITKLVDLTEARKACKRVFRSVGAGLPYPVFQDTIQELLLFYPTDILRLTRIQYSAIVHAASAAKEPGFYVSVVYDVAGQVTPYEEAYWCEYPPYDAYLQIPETPEENAVFGKTPWGVFLHDEELGFVGGSRQFIESVKKAYPDWRRDRDELYRVLRENPAETWIAEILTAVDEGRWRA